MKHGTNSFSANCIALTARTYRAGFQLREREGKHDMIASFGIHWQNNIGVVFTKECLAERAK